VFRTDNWLDNALSQQFPELFFFLEKAQISVKELYNLENLEDHFHRPLTVQAIQQLQQLPQLMLNTTLNQNEDQWGLPMVY
jgi:hypothetical protein